MENKIIKTKAPLRISFAGGGTDVEPYLADYGSYVLSAAINLYSRAICPCENTGLAIEKMLSEISDKGKVKILSDVYPEAGLGGSASCFVAGLKAIYPQLDNSQLAKLAFYLERKVMNNAGGMQDQICAAYGGLLFITLEGEHIGVEKLETENNFGKYLVLISVGKRVVPGDDIIKDQLRCYNVKALHRNKQLARLMKECLVQKNYLEFGGLLDEAWQCKKQQSCLVSNNDIDMLYQKLLALGAIGGVLAGAGAGGYMIVMEHPNKEGELRQNLVQQNIMYHNVVFDTLGARIVEA